ncbi:MAG: TrkH family potassium uptake protein [Deltaproteobacteria bacterium]|nr:TrkH family potassium uptake protein [Deltaproteobacteria bacterium]
MRVLVVLAIVGRLLRLFSLAFVPPLLFAVFDAEWTVAANFGIALGATLVFGFLFPMVEKEEMRVLHRAEALAVVSLTWLAIALFGAIPFSLAGLSFADSFFEAMSGFTTTGATILTDFSMEKWGKAFFLWRAMTQWIGGMGVIALFVVVLPKLGIAGRQLFFAEASGAPGEAVSPSVRHAASRLWGLYVALTAVLIGLLVGVGYDVYDAVCNAFTTLAAGGFSPNGESIMGYHNPAGEWILTVFMVISGMSFPLLYVTLLRRPLAIFRDEEFRFYLLATVLGAVGLALVLMNRHGVEAGEAIRAGAFQAASIISSTGFASADYNLWGDAAKIIIFFLMLFGGCAGSAAGGPKAIRHLLVMKHIFREFKRVLHPRAVIAIKYKGKAVDDNIMRTIFTLVLVFMAVYFFLGVFLVLSGHDIITAFSASLATVGNVGPGVNAAGPMGNFAFFGDGEKVVMTLGMWLGRLEMLTVLSLVHWHVWRDLHWRRFKPLPPAPLPKPSDPPPGAKRRPTGVGWRRR